MTILVTALTSAATGVAQTPPAVQPELQRLMNIDATDTATKLALMDDMLNKQDIQSNLLLFNSLYSDTVRLEMIQFKSDNTVAIPAYQFTSRKLDRAAKHPAVLMVHGGFHDHFDTYYFGPIAQAVEAGYVVLFPEYRGSSGYGEVHFENSYGTTDVADVLSGADYLSGLSFVDPGRLGIIGHSRGGMVTLLAIERAPKVFKVAVDIAGLADFVAYMSYKPEYRRLEVAKEATFGGKMPNERLQPYMDISPVNHVADIQAPLLVLANSFDKTVPYALHSGRLIELLKAYNKTFESHLYKDAAGAHMFPFANTVEGQDVWKRTFAWVGKYLKP